MKQRVLCWFSCGAPSAVAAKLAVEEYGRTHQVEVLHCDTLAYEHPDNRRFLAEAETFIGWPIKTLKSDKYTDIYDVFYKTRYLVGVRGARCTTELKKKLRLEYQRADDIHVFGYTKEEMDRVDEFKRNNPELYTDFILLRKDVSKRECLLKLADAGIELPAMYRLGYRNNNCIGCVKGGAGYWNKIRHDFPEMFAKMAQTERELNAAINKKFVGNQRIKVFLDELDPNAGDYPNEPDISCGVQCSFQFG